LGMECFWREWNNVWRVLGASGIISFCANANVIWM
jgi:hypothetical protein